MEMFPQGSQSAPEGWEGKVEGRKKKEEEMST